MRSLHHHHHHLPVVVQDVGQSVGHRDDGRLVKELQQHLLYLLLLAVVQTAGCLVQNQYSTESYTDTIKLITFIWN